MNENTMQIIVALVLVNLVAWGGYNYMQEESTKEYIDRIIYQQPEVLIANVTVTIDYNGAEENATKNTNTTIVNYNVTVTNDTSAYGATLEAGKNNFEIGVTWNDQFGAYIHSIDGIDSEGDHYWALYHNDEYAPLGSVDLILIEGDSITWKYESW
jgi:hypothetical protein|tara:strand:+ start:246 stop:713 length:468 start_codon:yes stop_codon:yes gene_type:complete